MNLARSCGPCAAFPRRRLVFSYDPYGVSQAIRRSDLRSLDSAVQSRVGDGLLVRRSDGAIRKRNSMELPVFPSTKFAVNVRGSKPAVDGDVPRPRPQRWG